MAQVAANVRWTDGERFIGSASSGHAIAIDSDRAHSNSASGPMELVLMALCSCTATDIVIVLNKKRVAFRQLTVSADALRSDQVPQVYTEIKLTYTVNRGVDPKAMEHAVQLSKDKYCSVSQMLQKSVKITADIVYI
jgi:putative redox protein